MREKGFIRFLGLFIGFVLILALSNSVLAQGKSGNKGKGKSKNSKSYGKEKGKKSDRKNSNYYYDDDFRYRGNKKRWKKNKNKRNKNKYKSNRFKGLSKKIGMSPEDAQDWFEREKDLNPDLTYGQFVAANMIARKNNSRYPRLTTERILDRLGDGQSLGQAVRDLGLKGRRYDDERRRLRREIIDRYKDKIDPRDRFDYRIGW